MDKVTKQRIEQFAWVCTIGRGVDPEECDQPDKDTLFALAMLLGHPPDNDEKRVLIKEWEKCIQMMEQP